MLTLLFAFLRALGFEDLTATLNCIPSGEARVRFSRALQEHARPHADAFGPEDRRRLEDNPLRLFDSKDPEVARVLSGAPSTLAFLDEDSARHHAELKALLAAAGVRFSESAAIVRGLDYYTRTVFEVASERLGAQNALLGGGRYDGLVAELGGPPTPAVGFAIGEDRLVAAMTADARRPRAVFWVIPDSKGEVAYAIALSEEIRAAFPEAVVETDLLGRGLGKGLARAGQALADPERYAFRTGGMHAVLLGSREREDDRVTIKDLASGEQQTFPRRELAERLGAGRDR